MSAPAVVVVIGGGLAGLSAALQCTRTAAELGTPVRVVILEKCASPGGNSFKASSGINATTASAGDTDALFEEDTLRSGGGLSEQDLVQRLVGDSQDALAFLSEAGVDLSRVSRLGGHSVARSHSNPAGPNVGFAITNALLTAAKGAPNVELLCSATVESLELQAGRVVGVTYSGPPASSSGKGSDSGSGSSRHTAEPVDRSGSAAAPEGAAVLQRLPADAVVIATGGYGASQELLQEYCPAACEYATTNGPWASGDGIRLALLAGAGLVHMDRVQLHPTGLVDPKAPDAKTKWLGPERLRGCGAVLLNHEGERFVDELERRDVVTSHMQTLPGRRAHLLVGPQAAEQAGVGALEFYCSKGMMTKAEGPAGVAAALRVPPARLQATLEAHNAAAAGEASDPCGRQHFACRIDLEAGPTYVASVTPVVHYCMGGVRVDPAARVLSSALQGRPIPGLYAAGEVTGGLHGANRLGGNSLLDCVVFGRVAGSSAAQDIASSAAAPCSAPLVPAPAPQCL